MGGRQVKVSVLHELCSRNGGDEFRVSEVAIALAEIALDTESRINRALLPRGVIEPYRPFLWVQELISFVRLVLKSLNESKGDKKYIQETTDTRWGAKTHRQMQSTDN